jgi:quercetin dioxygenase-like cupin family protein
MSKPKAKPAKIHYDAIPWGVVEGSSENLRIRRLITRGRQGSELMLGVASLDPGAETGWWSSMPEDEARPGEYWMGPVEETYYCTRGQLTLFCDEGEIEFGPDDAVYLAPGGHYKLKNTGDEAAFFIYNLYPPSE